MKFNLTQKTKDKLTTGAIILSVLLTIGLTIIKYEAGASQLNGQNNYSPALQKAP